MAKSQTTYTTAWYALAVTRLMVGFYFFWAFLDKTFGLGFSTESANAWINGGSPTTGFLTFGVNEASPFAEVFSSLAGYTWVDWLFMLGLLGIGTALILGAGVRIAAVTGSIMLVLMWLAVLPLTTNPVLDDHIIYAAILFVIAAAPLKWSVANWWRSLGFVKSNKWLW